MWRRYVFLLLSSSGAGTIRHEGARAPPLWEMARHRGHRKGNESRIKETLLDQVWLLTRLLLVATTSVTAERSFLAFRRLKHTCELRWASLDWTACWYCPAARTEPISWTWRPFPRNLSVHLTNVLFLEITWNRCKLQSQLCSYFALDTTDNFVWSWLVVDTSWIYVIWQTCHNYID